MAWQPKKAEPSFRDDPTLGMSIREQVLYVTDLGLALNAFAHKRELPSDSCVPEVSQALRTLHRLPPAMSRNSIDIPTCEPIFKQSSRDIQAMARRDLTVASNSGGGYLRRIENISFIELLRNRMVVREMGATVMSGLVGNVTIPKQTAAATGYWLTDETTAITESQQTFGQLALTPRTVGALTQVSRLLQLQSSPDALSLIMSDLANVVAVAVDLAAIAGTGTEQPTGIINTGSIGGFTGTSLDAVACINAQSDVAAANALRGSLGYVTTPAVAALLMARPELPSTGTTRLWQGNMREGTILGFKVMSSAQVPTADMIFGDWSQLVIGEWGVLELQTSESANTGDFSKGISTVRAMYSVDVGVRNAGAFSLATSIT